MDNHILIELQHNNVPILLDMSGRCIGPNSQIITYVVSKRIFHFSIVIGLYYIYN